MRTYLIFKDKAKQWNENKEIQAILAEIEETNKTNLVGKFTKEGSAKLLSTEFDRHQLASKGLKYERLDQLTMDILFGVD
jgi:xylose isomerase